MKVFILLALAAWTPCETDYVLKGTPPTIAAMAKPYFDCVVNEAKSKSEQEALTACKVVRERQIHEARVAIGETEKPVPQAVRKPFDWFDEIFLKQGCTDIRSES